MALATEDALHSECQLGCSLPPLVKGPKIGELELNVLSFEWGSGVNNFCGSAATMLEKVAEDLSYVKTVSVPGSGKPLKLKVSWWGEVGKGTLLSPRPSFKSESEKNEVPVFLDMATRPKHIARRTIKCYGEPNEKLPEVCGNKRCRIRYPLKSKWSGFRQYCLDAGTEGIRFEVFDSKSLENIGLGFFDSSIIDQRFNNQREIRITSKILVFERNNRVEDEIGATLKRKIGSLVVRVIVRMDQQTVSTNRLNGYLCSNGEKTKLDPCGAEEKNPRFPSMLTEFELHEIVAINDCNNLLPNLPAPATLHVCPSGKRRNLRVSSIWSQPGSFHVEKPSSSRTLGRATSRERTVLADRRKFNSQLNVYTYGKVDSRASAGSEGIKECHQIMREIKPGSDKKVYAVHAATSRPIESNGCLSTYRSPRADKKYISSVNDIRSICEENMGTLNALNMILTNGEILNKSMLKEMALTTSAGINLEMDCSELSRASIGDKPFEYNIHRPMGKIGRNYEKITDNSKINIGTAYSLKEHEFNENCLHQLPGKPKLSKEFLKNKGLFDFNEKLETICGIEVVVYDMNIRPCESPSSLSANDPNMRWEITVGVTGTDECKGTSYVRNASYSTTSVVLHTSKLCNVKSKYSKDIKDGFVQSSKLKIFTEFSFSSTNFERLLGENVHFEISTKTLAHTYEANFPLARMLASSTKHVETTLFLYCKTEKYWRGCLVVSLNFIKHRDSVKNFKGLELASPQKEIVSFRRQIEIEVAYFEVMRTELPSTLTSVRLVHRPWQVGFVRQNSFPWTEEATVSRTEGSRFFFHHRSLSAINLSLENLGTQVNNYIFEVWKATDNDAQKNLIGVCKIPFDNLWMARASMVDRSVELVAVCDGQFSVFDPFSGVKEGFLQVSITVGSEVAIRKRWFTRQFASLKITQFFRRLNAHYTNQTVLSSVHHGVESSMFNPSDDSTEVHMKTYSLIISLLGIMRTNGESIYMDHSMPSFVKYSFPFDGVGSTAKDFTLWLDSSNSCNSSSCFHHVEIPLDANEIVFLRNMVGSHEINQNLKFELWAWIPITAAGGSMDKACRSACVCIGVGTVPTETLINLFSLNKDIQKETIIFARTHPVHYEANSSDVDLKMKLVCQRAETCHQINQIVSKKPLAAERCTSVNSTLMVCIENVLSDVGAGCCEVEYSLFSGNKDDWNTFRTARSIDRFGSHAFNHENVVVLRITDELMNFFQFGEIEFKIFQHNSKEGMKAIGESVVSLKYLLLRKNGIWDSYPIIGIPDGISAQKRVGGIRLRLCLSHQRGNLVNVLPRLPLLGGKVADVSFEDHRPNKIEASDASPPIASNLSRKISVSIENVI